MGDNKKFYLRLIKLIFIALFLRFLIMPFSFHGGDIFWLNYFPFNFIEHKSYDPYLYLKENFPKLAYNFPVVFYFLIFFQILFKPFMPKLKELYSVFHSWNFVWSGNTVHFADILLDHQLFRTLFFFKIPYLICDFVVGIILYQLLKNNKTKVFIALIIWALNPFVLQSVYAFGQLDITVAMFIMLSILAIKLEKPYFAIICLSLGAGIKIIPLLLVPPVIIILGETLKERLKLVFNFLISFLVLFIPFYFTSKFAAFEALTTGEKIGIPTFKRDIFILIYLCFLAILYFFKKKDIDTLRAIIFSFIFILLLFYSIYNVTLRYFVWITPLLILLAVENRIFWIYNTIFFISLFILRTGGNTQQWGLFAALHPEFFSSLPIVDSYLNLLVNVKYIHQFMYRLFLVLSLIMVIHIFVVNRDLFKFPRLVRAKDEKN